MHDVDAMHAMDAVVIVDNERIAIQAHTSCRAAVEDVCGYILSAVPLDEAGDFLLVDPDVVPPGAYDRHIRAHHRPGAVVGAAGKLELVFVGELRPVQLVDESVCEKFG